MPEDTTPALAIGVCVAALSFGLLMQLALRGLKTRVPDLPLPPEGLTWWALGILLSVLLEADALPPAAARVVSLLDDSYATFFFQALLPPIIFHSGWALAAGGAKKADRGTVVAIHGDDDGNGLDLDSFSTHIRPALVLAIVGTLVSSLVTAIVMVLAARTGVVYAFTWMHCLLLAVAVSATDTVCVLSLLRELRVPSQLYATVFGESLFNDAVTIVLFRALSAYEAGSRDPSANAGSLMLWASGEMLWGFAASSAIGCLTAVAAALLFKYGCLSLAGSSGCDVERSLLAMLPFLCYMAAEASGASGVVSALACGVLTAVVVQRHVSEQSAAFAGQLYSTAGSLAEHLTFLFLGVATTEIGGPAMAKHWPAAVVLLVGCCLGRAAGVAASISLINRLTSTAGSKVSKAMGAVVFNCGLRGGVAFALASAAAGMIPDKEAASAFPIAAIFVAAVTLPAISVSTGPLVRYLGLTVELVWRHAETGQIERDASAVHPPNSPHVDPPAVPPDQSARGITGRRLRLATNGIAASVMSTLRSILCERAMGEAAERVGSEAFYESSMAVRPVRTDVEVALEASDAADGSSSTAIRSARRPSQLELLPSVEDEIGLNAPRPQ